MGAGIIERERYRTPGNRVNGFLHREWVRKPTAAGTRLWIDPGRWHASASEFCINASSIDIMMPHRKIPGVRTTISINDELLRLARERALKRSCSLGGVIDEALRAALATRPKTARLPVAEPIVTYRGTGVFPAVDLSCSADLLQRMEGET